MNVTKMTVAMAAAASSTTTATANSHVEGTCCQAMAANSRFVPAMASPATASENTTPRVTANQPPINVNTTVVTQPSPFEYSPMSDFEKPMSS